MKHASLLVIPFLLASWSTAFSQPNEEVARKKQEQPQTSVTAGVFTAMGGTADISVERRLSDKFSVAGLATYTIIDDPEYGSTIRAGAQARYYVTTRVLLGVQATAQHDTFQFDGVDGSGEAYAAGAFVGYKWVGWKGLTLEALLGYEAYLYNFSLERGPQMEGSGTDHMLLVSANAGWSF